MFDAQEADAIFFEKAVHLKRFPHMVLECVPLPISAGETAPIYFKVCIQKFLFKSLKVFNICSICRKLCLNASPNGP